MYNLETQTSYVQQPPSNIVGLQANTLTSEAEREHYVAFMVRLRNEISDLLDRGFYLVCAPVRGLKSPAIGDLEDLRIVRGKENERNVFVYDKHRALTGAAPMYILGVYTLADAAKQVIVFRVASAVYMTLPVEFTPFGWEGLHVASALAGSVCGLYPVYP